MRNIVMVAALSLFPLAAHAADCTVTVDRARPGKPPIEVDDTSRMVGAASDVDFKHYRFIVKNCRGIMLHNPIDHVMGAAPKTTAQSAGIHCLGMVTAKAMGKIASPQNQRVTCTDNR